MGDPQIGCDDLIMHIQRNCTCTRIDGNYTSRRCLSKISAQSQDATSHFPTATPPDPGKDCVCGHFSHFNRHFPGRLSLRGQRSISHILTGAFSYCQLPQQRPNGPVQGLLRGPAEGPWQLISVWPARCKQRWASATLTVKKATQAVFSSSEAFYSLLSLNSAS